MALGNALVDRARPVRRVQQGVFLPAPSGVVAKRVAPSPGIVSNLLAGSYRWAVTAVTAEGGETLSGVSAAVVVSLDGERARVSWQALVGATSYRIYRSLGVGAFLRVGEVTATTLLDAGLAAGVQIPPTTNTARGRASGASVFTDAEGPWFRCRLELPDVNVNPDGSGRRRVIRVPTLMYGYLDTSGDPVVLNEEARVEVDSNELGSEIWQVNGRPKPMRKKRRVIGWEVQVKRMEALESVELT